MGYSDMVMTRREIIKKGIAISTLMTVPPLLLHVLHDPEKYNDEIARMLDNCIKPDVIVLYESSVDNLDFIALKYDREAMNAPATVWYKSPAYKPERNDYDKILYTLRLYAKTNEVMIYSDRTEENLPAEKLKQLISMIRKNSICGTEPCEIPDHLYETVASIYAKCYTHHRQLEDCSTHRV
jgi:type III secretion system FlhB-like substrate exporter